MGLFGKSQGKDPKEQVDTWVRNLRKEGRQLDRQIRGIQREQEKATRAVKDAAKKGDKEACKILAKEIVHSRKAVNRIYASKAQINSVIMGMKHQLATIKLTGCLEKSTEVMKAMQSLVKMPEISAIMQALSKEMMKAGIMEEMVEDAMEGFEDQDELEEEAEEEVEKILFEVTAGVMGKAPAKVTDTLPSVEPEAAAADVDDEEEVEEMKARLEALRS